MKKIFQQLTKKEIILILICMFLICFQVRLDLELPEYMGNIAELVKKEGTHISEIIKQGKMMLIITLGSVGISIFLVLFSSKIAANFSARLRLKIYETVQNFSMENVKDFSIASLITRETNDVVQVQSAIVQGIQIFTKAPILAGWAIIKILDKNPVRSTATALAIGILIIMAILTLILVIPKFRIIQKLVDKLNNVAREHINGIRVVRAHNAEIYQEKKFDKANSELMKTHLFTAKTMSILMPSVDTIMNILILSVYFLGGVIIAQAALSERLGLFSDMMVFSAYASQLVMAFVMLVFILVLIPGAAVSAKRIAAVLNAESSIKDGNGKGKESGKGTVEFKNVSFKYPDAEEYVIQNITFKVEKGETIALIGATGCGKSTIINLIPRFYDATNGEILINGINIKNYKQKELRNKIGYIPQKAFLFKGSIKDNILLGLEEKKRNKKNLEIAAEVSESKEFIQDLEDKFDNFVALNGTNYSGGQKQRLSIARAIARKPEILIFDDSFSALDYKTDLKLRNNLKKYLEGTTVFIVAQRIGTIKHADKILVIEDGKCVGEGTHEELIKNNKVYQEIALSQLSEDELKNTL